MGISQDEMGKLTQEILQAGGTLAAAKDREIARLREALEAAKQKLELYRSASNGAYLGGLEYSELVKKIDAALAQDGRE